MFKAISILATAALLIINPFAPKTETTATTETYYPTLAVVTKTNTETDSVTIMTLPDGNLWDFSGVEDWSGGDLAVCIFSDNGTPNYEDDEIVTVRYVGYVDGENSTSETGEKLEYFNLNGTVWDLGEN